MGILAVGLCIILLFLTVVVVAVTSVYIEQRKLQLLADQCADAATTSISSMSGLSDGVRPVPALKDDEVSRSTQEVLTTVPHGLDGLAVAGAGTEGANTARVELVATAHPPLVGVFLPAGVMIEAESSSRVVLTQ